MNLHLHFSVGGKNNICANKRWRKEKRQIKNLNQCDIDILTKNLKEI